MSTCLHVLVKIVDRGCKVMIASSLCRRFTRRDDDQLHAKFVLSFACEHATHVAYLIALENLNTCVLLIVAHNSRDHAIQEKQTAGAHHIHTNGLIRRGGPRLQQANPRARSSCRLRRHNTPIQQAPKTAVKRNKHKRRRDVAHASR